MPHEPSRWPMFRRVWRQADLFDRMAQELHVEMARAIRHDGGEAVRIARSRCLDCRHADACSDWLDAASGLPLPPGFCPNADWLSDCREGEPVSSTEGGARAGTPQRPN